ncbi:hypothetical protein Pcinc_004330 [Petrolisthes cinctipes]|uniref:Uncharacterized protein n=1 Tax=Petrolisthes cinctipes TaxID=88211 RepID=A0AAE1FRL5_PETCI|nr:hypothetical protein Pcinc_016940 [Petrolisthes cinctipes]KAK3891790.1 hypothetical protein Pcinc_004330 [Petrolisthes cinctipes]
MSDDPGAAVTCYRMFQKVVQAEVDAATQQACELRHKVTEKDVALDLTACHLRQQDDARDALKDTVTAALALLHQAAFTVCNATIASY